MICKEWRVRGVTLRSVTVCPPLLLKEEDLIDDLMAVLTQAGFGPVVSWEFPRPASVISALDGVVISHVVEHVLWIT